jgi:hypothetical protein
MVEDMPAHGPPVRRRLALGFHRPGCGLRGRRRRRRSTRGDKAEHSDDET